MKGPEFNKTKVSKWINSNFKKTFITHYNLT
jgi:hypothetical protein